MFLLCVGGGGGGGEGKEKKKLVDGRGVVGTLVQGGCVCI